jgi:hypothetical protein
MADELLGALACAWDAIRARHHDVPPVVLVVGSGSRRGVKRSRWGSSHPSGGAQPGRQVQAGGKPGSRRLTMRWRTAI